MSLRQERHDDERDRLRALDEEEDELVDALWANEPDPDAQYDRQREEAMG